MVRILRIISQISVVGTCAIAIFVLIFGFKPHLEIQTLLSQASIIEEFKKNCSDSAKKDDKESPLVVQAREFALRIDPPPPPIKITPLRPKPDSEYQIIVESHDLDTRPPKELIELKLIGTASYRDYPEKSLALLNLVSGGYKWVRQGETIGQATISEIKDGKIILCQTGKKEKELFVPKPQSPLKPLLKKQG